MTIRQSGQIFRSLGGLKLWEVRHSHVLDFIEAKQIKTMIDIGTSQSTLLMKVQRGFTVAHMIGLDIDDEVLVKAKQNLMPEGIQNDCQFTREYNQLVHLYKGSGLDKYKQLKQLKIDLITLVEVIEHIEQKNIQKLTQNIFNYLKPSYVWMSTPNSEFNTLFKWDTGRKFRHDDHKFQWTRMQFQTYVNMVCQKYNYKAIITGVGQSIDDQNLNKGFCSQIAIFQREKDTQYKFKPNATYEDLSQQIETEPQISLELKHQHINLCWRSNYDHLLETAMKQIASFCESKEYLTWHQVIQSLKRKSFIKKLRQVQNVWRFDYHLKNSVFEYLKNHKQLQIGCSKQGIRQLALTNADENASNNDMAMLDEEFEKQMRQQNEIRNQGLQIIDENERRKKQIQIKFYNYDNQQILLHRRSLKSKKSKSQKSKSSSSSGSSSQSDNSASPSSSSGNNRKSDSSWGSVQALDEEEQRRKVGESRIRSIRIKRYRNEQQKMI